MNLTHLHLILNHIPVVGSLCALGLLAFALWRQCEDVKRTALAVLVISALVAIPAYLTGEPAEGGVNGLPGVSQPRIKQHEEAASVALGGVLGVGTLALAGLVWFRGKRLMPAWFGVLMLTGALVVSGVMAWTASLGGQVHHPEIRAGIFTHSEKERHHD